MANNVSATEGGGSVDTVVKLSDGIEKGEWGNVAAQGAGLGLEALGIVVDPFGALVSAGISWAIEHIEPLRKPLDDLLGDPRTIKAASQDWHTKSAKLHELAKEISTQAKKDTKDWEGDAGDAYRAAAEKFSGFVDGLGSGATGVAGAIHGAGVVVGTVRSIVRDLISSPISEVIRYVLIALGASWVTFGASLGAAVAWIVSRVGVTMGKVTQQLSKLMTHLSDLLGQMGRLGSALGKVGDDAGRLVATGASKVDTLAGSFGRSNLVRSGFNGSMAESVDNAMGKVQPSAFTNATRNAEGRLVSDGVEFTPMLSGDIVKGTSETLKGASEVDENWQQQTSNAEKEAGP